MIKLPTQTPIALLLSLVLFWVESIKNDQEFDKTIENLKRIENSLSTKHIGIFPDYIKEINHLFSETLPQDVDTSKQIIIFQDVLFYGAFYKGEDFKIMIDNLFKLSSQKRKITLVYYNNTTPNNRKFREITQLSWLEQNDLAKLERDRRQMVSDSTWMPRIKGRHRFRMADSVASEKYFAIYKGNKHSDKTKDFQERLKRVLVPLSTTNTDHVIFNRIDGIRREYLDKDIKLITFSDIYNTYYHMTEEIKTVFAANNLKLIPINDDLVMTCWSNGDKALFALPAKFAANEIGFVSQDITILEYIKTMLNGVKNQTKNRD